MITRTVVRLFYLISCFKRMQMFRSMYFLFWSLMLKRSRDQPLTTLSTIQAVAYDMDAVLDRLLRVQDIPRSRPFILLTWAQTTDAMLSHTPGARTQISGHQSSALTHSLRALHDVILVGIGTILADDPRLSTRLDTHTRKIVHNALERYKRAITHHDACPTAAVLDSQLRTPVSAKFLSQPHCANATRRPFVFTGERQVKNPNYIPLRERAEIIDVDVDHTRVGAKLSLTNVVDRLQQKGVKSIMVEGGPTILASFIAAGLYDLVIITLAPVIFGKGVPLMGNHLMPQSAVTRFLEPQWVQLGDDMVLIGAPT